MGSKAKLLRIFVGQHATWQDQPLYLVLVARMKQRGLAGVTVFRGVEGYGTIQDSLSTRILDLSVDLPITVDCIDTECNITAILPEIKHMVTKGLIITADVEVH